MNTPQPNFALQELRTILGWTHGKLADVTNVSRSYVQAVEKGRRVPNLNFCRNIENATGASAEAIIAGRGALLDLEGLPYTPDRYAAHRARQVDVHGEELQVIFRAIERIITAAEDARLTTFIRDGLHLFISDFVLWSIDNCALRECLKLVDPVELRVGELRQNPQFAAALGFVDDPSEPDEKTVTFKPQAGRPQTQSEILENLLLSPRLRKDVYRVSRNALSIAARDQGKVYGMMKHRTHDMQMRDYTQPIGADLPQNE